MYQLIITPPLLPNDTVCENILDNSPMAHLNVLSYQSPKDSEERHEDLSEWPCLNQCSNHYLPETKQYH